MHSTIQQILTTTKNRIQAFESQPKSQPKLQPGAETPACPFKKRDFASSVATAKAAGLVPVIAEVKPASPKKVFREIFPERAAGFAREMEAAGAVAISVLTEPEIFRGSVENLERVRKAVSLPALRKDFIIDRRQFEEAESDLVLLIAGFLKEKLSEHVELARAKGFEPLVEVHNKEELQQALATKAEVIGINNRDLETMEIRIETTEKLAPLIREHDRQNETSHIIVSESGICGPEDIRRVLSAGADAVLVGSSIMESESVFEKTRELVRAPPGWRW